MKKLLVCVLAAALLALSACAPKKAESDITVLKLGINGNEYRVWNSVNERLKEHNIQLEIVSFSDYVKPNQALADGEIDLNAFQTQIFFEDFVEKQKKELSILNYTVFAPMGLYSNKHTSLDEIQDKAVIAIPNDRSNGGRALILMQTQGWITLREGSGLTPTLVDIIANPKQLEIVEMAATQIPRSLQDVDYACINNGVVVDAKMSVKNDSLILENLDDDVTKNYFNIVAVKTKDLNNPAIQKVKEVYQQEATKAIIEEVYGGSQTPAWD